MVRRRSIGTAAAALLVVASCGGYRTVTFERKIMSAHPALAAGRVPAGERAAGKTTLRFPAVRYLVLSRSSSPVGVINDRAVGLAERSRLGEAEVLFREALAEDPGLAAASNNLGVVCELTGRRAEAFGHYAAACLRERDNALFRSNFLGFADRRADGE